MNSVVQNHVGNAKRRINHVCGGSIQVTILRSYVGCGVHGRVTLCTLASVPRKIHLHKFWLKNSVGPVNNEIRVRQRRDQGFHHLLYKA